MIKIFYTFLLLIICSFSFGADTLSINNSKTKISPAYANYQLHYFPVFIINIPDGFTDFELKASITNFKGTGANPDNSHDGSEIIFYFHSNAPYIGTSGRAPLQKFNPLLTRVYFKVSKASKYTKLYNNVLSWVNVSGNWDGRKYIYQLINPDLTSITTNEYSLSNYLAPNARVTSVMIVVGWDKTATSGFDNIMETNCKPTNNNLTWSILYQNSVTSERDSNNNPLWRAITPIEWIDNCNLKTNVIQ